ncbi:sulfotransferase [Parasphingopyxis sp. CP4]|uniref:hypothetical protein n=1 Tax=Parasphingopyxis sp. CP4 TaxID=2724527 RepID=UPI0015A09FB1|nr:hypothetical protein [Parasphingopyxis sp. CP4]QLC20919.1 sulfotransferase [Parasphingopyxis sp. CP4]
MLGKDVSLLDYLEREGLLSRISDIFVRTLAGSVIGDDFGEGPAKTWLRRNQFDRIFDLAGATDPEIKIFAAFRFPQRQQMEQLSIQVGQHNAEKERLENAVADRINAFRTARRDLTMALRLQLVREADLKDLQSRFSHLRQQLQSVSGADQDSTADKDQKGAKSAASPLETGEPVRTVHNLACVGGTLFNRCLGAMPNTQLLSEVEPLSQLTQSNRFVPADLISLLRFGSRPADDALSVEIFLAGMDVLYRDASSRGLHLILRDHAHSIFCDGPGLQSRLHLRAVLEKTYALRSILFVRHPLASFSSLQVNEWLHFSPPTLDTYAERYLAFLDAHKGVDQMRYEDFLENPEKEMQRACKILGLDYNPEFIDTFSAFSLSGDSGRTGDVIAPRKPRAITEELAQAAEASAAYGKLCKTLQYPIIQPDTELQTTSQD